MSETNMGEMLFQNQRFNIISLKIQEKENGIKLISDEYAYAWDVKLYPYIDDDKNDYHKPYDKYFNIKKHDVKKVSEFLDENWRGKNHITFYELEKHYDELHENSFSFSSNSLGRNKLLKICRYLFLHDTFDTEFFSTLCENGECPVEAQSITRKFDIERLFIS